MNKYKLPKVPCKYGAPMGRSDSIIDPDAPVKFSLQHVPLNSGGYDAGGAYWGHDERLYWACGYVESDLFEIFTRAQNRNDAKSKIRQYYPLATFTR